MPQIHLRVSDDIHQRLVLASTADRRTLTAHINHLLDTALPVLPKAPAVVQAQPQEARGLRRDIRMPGFGSNR